MQGRFGSEEAQESQVMRMANHQSRAPSPGSLVPSPQSQAPSSRSRGPKDLPPGVPPEPELRDHLGRTTASTVEKWEQWYHQWHREIREYNPNYDFQT